MRPSDEPLETPRPWGCIAGLLWLVMLIFTVLLLSAGYSTWSQGIHKDQPTVASFGRWLLLAGAASTAILCSSLIIVMRLRRFNKRQK